MRRCDWLIMFLAAEPGGPLDPVRVQKGMFLLAMSESLDPAERYRFEPYAYGPMSRALYSDVRLLCRERVLEALPIEGATWRLLELTAAGKRGAARLRDEAARDQAAALERLAAIRREISTLTFSALLEHVYHRYPDYAVRSVFRRSR